MSTRGSFIIRKNNEDKELFIPSDAYPDSGGRDAVRLIKSLDLNALYDLLVTEDDLFDAYPEEEIPSEDPQDFSLRLCVDAVRSGTKYLYRDVGHWYIQNSLECEYGYVLDLDERKLLFYVGFQKRAQEGNRYGTKSFRGYYPCRLAAVFSFDYIRQNSTADVVRQMSTVDEAGGDEICTFDADPSKEAAVPEKPQGIRQLIIARKDLGMSPGKLASQVSHASMAFMADMLRRGRAEEVLSPDSCEVASYRITVDVKADIYHDWLGGIFTKTVCEARNRNHLTKAVTMAEEMGLREGEDFYLIWDRCLTELEPEEYDENGIGQTLTCIGFRPLPDDIAHAISRKYQLYR